MNTPKLLAIKNLAKMELTKSKPASQLYITKSDVEKKIRQ